MPRRVDNTHREIIAALRQVGCSVADTHELGGFVDAVAGFIGPDGRPTNLLLEIKRPGGTLTPAQQMFIMLWRGPIAVVASVEEALRAVGCGEG